MTRALFRRSQLAPEAVVGTALAATHQLMGALAIKNAPERVRREEHRNSMGGSITWTDLAYRSELRYTGRCVPQELPFFLASGIRGDIAPASSVWTYSQPLATIPSLKSLCMYGGDNTQALRAAGCYTRQLTIEGRDTGIWSTTADIFGREVVIGTFNTGLSSLVGSTAKNLFSRVYIDDTGAGIGGTQLLSTFYGFRWVWTSGIEPDYTMDGALDMNDIHRDEPTCVLELTAKWNAAAVAEYTNYRNLTPRFIRVANDIGGANETKLDGCYVATDFTPLAEERNGTTLATVQFTAVENTTWNKKIEVSVKNTLTASDLPAA